MSTMKGKSTLDNLPPSLSTFIGRQYELGEVQKLGLSARERAAALLIVEGKSNRKIAEAMTVNVKMVEAYVTRIFNNLGFDSRVQIATWAIAKGLPASSQLGESR